MGISQSTIEKVRRYDDIVGIIGQYVQLKKRGQNYIGLCPFHSEKTPSFTVSPTKHIFHCFGCHETGDLISFVQKIENATFPESIEIIAGLSGIELEHDDSNMVLTGHDANRQKISDCLAVMKSYFQDQLEHSELALSYLDSRGIWPQTIRSFQLGYGGKSSDLLAYLKSRGYEPDLLLKTGCFYGSSGEGVFCRFQDRLVFPILNFQGKTVGFGGRLLKNSPDQAKYVNSEETPFFNKRKLLYGYVQAKPQIKQENLVILMEGYMDVITAHQHGFATAVGSMGTALTDEQVQRLRHGHPTVVLAFDSDEAGQLAIKRSFEVLQKYEINSKIIDFTEKDPADVLNTPGGVDYFEDQLQHAMGIVEYFIDLFSQNVDRHSIDSITECLTQITPILKSVRDPVVLNYYVNSISLKLGVESQLVLEKIRSTDYNAPHRKNYDYKNKRNKLVKAEDILLYFAAMDLSVRHQLIGESELTHLLSAPNYALLLELSSLSSVGPALLNELKTEEYKKELGRLFLEVPQLQGSEPSSSTQSSTWMDCLSTLKLHYKTQRIQVLKTKIRELENLGQDDEALQLLQELQRLMTN